MTSLFFLQLCIVLALLAAGRHLMTRQQRARKLVRVNRVVQAMWRRL